MKKTMLDEKLVLKLIKESTSIRQVILKLGLAAKGTPHYRKIHQIMDKYGVDSSHFLGQAANRGKKYPERTKKRLKDYLKKDTYITSFKLKNMLFAVEMLKRQCSMCGLIEWRGKPAPLELDHMNGKTTDNRLDNLRILCPNCHAQTDNYCGLNKGSK